MSRCPVCDHEVHVDGCVGAAYQAIVAKVAREQAIEECVYVAEAIASQWRVLGSVRAASASEVALHIRALVNK